MNIHEKYISRCIELGKLGIGNTCPNPAVGSCIVYNNKIIGEGHTSRPGKNHAEINAINSVKIKSQLKGSTLYVTLEPCSHHGKTPPCTNEIIKNKIHRANTSSFTPEPLSKDIRKEMYNNYFLDDIKKLESILGRKMNWQE